MMKLPYFLPGVREQFSFSWCFPGVILVVLFGVWKQFVFCHKEKVRVPFLFMKGMSMVMSEMYFLSALVSYFLCAPFLKKSYYDEKNPFSYFLIFKGRGVVPRWVVRFSQALSRSWRLEEGVGFFQCHFE